MNIIVKKPKQPLIIIYVGERRGAHLMVVVSAICLNVCICEVFLSVQSTSIMTCNRISDLF